MAPPAPSGGSILTRRIGGLPGWQWAALLGGGGGLVWYVIRSRSGATANAGAPGSAGSGAIDPATGLPYQYGPGPGGQVLAPIVIQTGPPSKPGAKGAPGPRGPAGPPGKPAPKPGRKPPPKPAPGGTGHRLNPADFPRTIAGLTAQGRNMARFGTVQNGRITGGNVGNSGAPVYALIQTGYGPIWEQFFDPKKVPNGTAIATLPQFKSDVKK